jgi:N-acetylneuraminic acid mutarotase
MRIKGNGNVGIGTASPEGALHLKSNNWIKTIFENNTGEPRGYMGVDNNGTLTLGSNAYWNGSSWIYPFSGSSLYMLLHRLNNRFEFRVRPDGGNQATAMTIDTGSNVGIGGNLVIDQENGNTGTLSTNTLRFGNLSGEGIGSKRNSGSGQWGLDFYTNSINRMTVANNGNIGIGTISPQNTLDINGAIKIGSNSINQAGSIRYLNNTFEGYNGSEWNSFDQTPKGTLVGSSVYPDNDLLNNGYAYKGQIPNILQQQTTTGVSANTWLSTSTQATVDPGSRQEHTAVWTGTEMIVWGGRLNYSTGDVDDGARYNPEVNLWTATNINNVPTPRSSHTSVWTGTEMIVWGGRYYNGGSYSHFNSGAKYTPTSDSWTPTTNTNAPGIRSDHTAVWTGTEMIVWGGEYMQGDTLNIPINTGAKYNPTTNTWTTISTVNAPAARSHHTAIWTGTEMIIWGGSNEQYNYNLGYVVAGNYLNTGAKYNPTTNTWTTITITNAPTARALHSAVWSGTEMIIWGGGTSTITNTGSRYNPSTNTWAAMSSSGASGPVAYHNAVWTGSNMLVWGGSNVQYGAGFVGYPNVYTSLPIVKGQQ